MTNQDALVERHAPQAGLDLYRSDNQAADLVDYNAYDTDAALREAVHRHGADWAEASLREQGAHTGSAAVIRWGFLANTNKPVLKPFDRRGNRVDLVEYDESYHRLMASALERRTHSEPWVDDRPGAHVARAARSYLNVQVDAGHDCPVIMTHSVVPAIKYAPGLAAQWLPKINNNRYDQRNVPWFDKDAVTIGMGMTEKQGGSDVRSNITWARPLGARGPEQAYELFGHKWFTSAPMCDAFLILARTEKDLSCFLVPRWRPDGSKNPIELQRLKEKLGNVSNASSELVLRGAMGWLVGEEDRGISTIMHMVALTRLGCMVEGVAGQRQAIVQAAHHCKWRSVFGKRLIEQPLMRNVLADLQLELEGSLAITMRMAKALDGVFAARPDEHEQQLARLGLAVGKYWVTKRTPSVTYEALECLGGNGTIEEFISARLYRDAPINAIWEGSGNVQALDIKRAIVKDARALDAWFAEMEAVQGADGSLDRLIREIKKDVGVGAYDDYVARQVIEKMALAMQSSLLLQTGRPEIGELFITSRLDRRGIGNFGNLPPHPAVDVLLERADASTRAALEYAPQQAMPLAGSLAGAAARPG